MDADGGSSRDPIVRTKLRPPSLSSGLLRRKRLHEQLDSGLGTALTLVSAPAGYGKSTLVAHWVEGLGSPSAWVSLDEADSDLGVFLDYLVAALETIAPGTCEQTGTLLRGSSLPPLSLLTRTLANELDALEDCVLVLDDYHRIAGDSAVQDLLSQLLEHPPRSLRLVLVTRRDPPLAISRLRADGRMTELRLQDLRFEDAEAAELLALAAHVSVGGEALGNLQREVEGWAVGLRLVSLALTHVAEPDLFLRNLRGGLPHTQEYLFREVLDWQPVKVRRCLLRTSILERFCPALVDALCASDDAGAPTTFSGRDFVDLLRQGNLFTLALDSHGEWWRYHHLFQEVLLSELAALGADEVADLHVRASRWFESQGWIEESVRHALAAGETTLAAEIVERHGQAELNADRWYVLERWLNLLPLDVRRERPALQLTAAWMAFTRLQLERIPPILERVEHLFEGREMDSGSRGELAFFRGNQAYWEGRPGESRELLGEALRLLDGRRPHVESNAEILLGLSRAMLGEGDGAIAALKKRIHAHTAPKGQYFAHLVAALVFIHYLSGDLGRARTQARRLHQVATESGLSTTAGWGGYFRGCIALQSADLDRAVDHLREVARLRYALDSEAAIDALAGLALAHQLARRTDAADEALGSLEELAGELNHPPYLRVVESCRARLTLLRGTAGPPPQAIPAEASPTTPAELFMWLEIPTITRARILVAAGTPECLDEAGSILGSLREVAESSRFKCQAIELAVLEALSLEKGGRVDPASQALKRAVSLAAPGGWIRPFLEAGPLMRDMLQRLGRRSGQASFRQSILDAFDAWSATSVETAHREVPEQLERAPVLPPGQDLTHRELDVLELLAKRLQNKEIAAQLFISAHTVNDHLKHIYQKLGVRGRREAVRRATGLGLLDPPASR